MLSERAGQLLDLPAFGGELGEVPSTELVACALLLHRMERHCDDWEGGAWYGSDWDGGPLLDRIELELARRRCTRRPTCRLRRLAARVGLWLLARSAS